MKPSSLCYKTLHDGYVFPYLGSLVFPVAGFEDGRNTAVTVAAVSSKLWGPGR